MKKVLLIMLSIFFIYKYSYAVEISIGFYSGAGGIVNRGEGYKDFKNAVEEINLYEKNFLSIAINLNLAIMIQFKDYVALETGFEFDGSRGLYYYPDEKQHLFEPRLGLGFSEVAIGIPIMLRFQKEWSRVLVYASVGPKFNFETSDFINGDDKYNIIIQQAKNNIFVLDIGFATGIEFRLGKANYLGIRANYNLNVLAPVTFDGKELYHDTYFFGLTYRYAFNSKWKKVDNNN